MAHKCDFRDYFNYIAGGLLTVIGFILYYLFRNEGFAHSLSEFLMLAGILTLSVDPWLKWRFQREASENIFQHLLGFGLPKEVRESLRDFLSDNRYYRTDVVIDAHVAPISSSQVEVRLTIRGKVKAIAKTPYQQHISFEEAENGQILSASITSNLHHEKSYNKSDVTLSVVEEEPMVYGWSGETINLKKDEEIETWVELKITRPISGWHVINLGTLTINPVIRLTADSGLEVSADKPDRKNGPEFYYDRVFVKGDHIQIRWKPKPPLASGKSA